MVLQNVKADTTVCVDVWMVNLGLKLALGWFEGIIGRELNIKEEDTSLVGGVTRAHDHSLPVEHVVVVDRACRDRLRTVFLKICEFFRKTLLSHFNKFF